VTRNGTGADAGADGIHGPEAPGVAGSVDAPTRQQRADDAARLEDAVHVLHGSDGTGAVRRVLYAVYVIALLALSYGFTVSRALFITSDPAWVRDRLLGPVSAVVALVLVAGLVVVVHGIGRRRGAVVPPLPWVDHVVAGPLDRAATLREWWLVSATLLLAGCTVAAGVVGGGLWAAGSTGPAALWVALVVGPLVGAAIAAAWLTGQVGRFTLARPSTLLRRLGLTELRAQSIRSTRLGGAVLAGDLRAARLETATPVRRGRGLRLRSRGRLGTVVMRDLLGLRRQPGLLLSGVLLAAPGAAGVAWALCDREVPVPVAVAAVTATYLGAGVWAEGLRLLGDTLGTPSLSGLALGTEAGAHTVLPAVLLLVTSVPVALGVHALVPATGVSAIALVLWVVGLAGVVVLAQWVAAFRGRPPILAFLPEVGPMAMAFWYARPLILGAVTGGLLTSRAAVGSVPAASWFALFATVAGAAWWARRALRTAADEHRI